MYADESRLNYLNNNQRHNSRVFDELRAPFLFYNGW